MEKLNELQRFRGPDGHGVWSSSDGRVVLGHRRLSIIDTDPRSSQPMLDVSGRWVVTYNGEIYNYRQLRSELEEQGWQFRTSSDTEVLIGVIATWGEAGIARLRGMFAFALWDTLERELWLARDPFGIKPLYFGERDGQVWFASQARALAAVAPVDLTRDAAGLTGFYLWGHVPEPFTWWKGIRSLPAGHVSRITLDERKTCRPFASIEASFDRHLAAPIDEDGLRAALQDSVRHHLVSDVDVGVFLSAGIDSTVVACLVAESAARPKTITLAFDDFLGTPSDEAPLAEATARLLGTEHTTVRLSRTRVEDVFDSFFARMDLPTIDGLNTFFVSFAARSAGLKVALSGLGADELFGGYPSFSQIPTLLRAGERLRSLGPLVTKTADALVHAAALPSSRKKIRGVVGHSQTVDRAFFLRRSLYLEDELPALLDECWIRDGVEQLNQAHRRDQSPPDGASIRTQVSLLEMKRYMRNQLLRDSDWAGMAHGLEIRVPFVDKVLLDRLAPAIASERPPTKQDLANSSSLVPAAVKSRKKTGFTTPVGSWNSGGGSLRGWATTVHRRFSAQPPSQTDVAFQPLLHPTPRDALAPAA